MKLIPFLFSLICFNSFSQTVVPMSHDGLLRNFIYYKPSTWDASQELPLLIVLHGLTQTAVGIMEITNFNTIAEENNFIVCYPDGNNNAWNANMNVSVSSTDDKGFINIYVDFQMVDS
jgi:poly(3-hydroxybutyrate) depolymerase